MTRTRALVFVAFAAVAALAAARLIPRSEDPPRAVDLGFRFCRGRGGPPRRDESAWSYPLVFGLLVALRPEEARSLGSALEEANRRWDTKANPLIEDLDETDPDDALAQWLEHPPVAATTAMAAARTRFCGTDGFCVRVVPRASPCPSTYEPLGDEDARVNDRALFLAWPFGHAVWLRARTPEAASSTVTALRAHALDDPTTGIGLVLHVGDDERSRVTTGALRDELIRHEVLRRKATQQDLDEDDGDAAAPFRVGGDGGAGAGTAFPADMDPLDVIVLPRLEAIQEPGSLAKEIRATAPGVPIVFDGRPIAVLP